MSYVTFNASSLCSSFLQLRSLLTTITRKDVLTQRALFFPVRLLVYTFLPYCSKVNLVEHFWQLTYKFKFLNHRGMWNISSASWRTSTERISLVVGILLTNSYDTIFSRYCLDFRNHCIYWRCFEFWSSQFILLLYVNLSFWFWVALQHSYQFGSVIGLLIWFTSFTGVC